MTEARKYVRLETKECADFLERIRSRFNYLFDEYGFEAFASDEDRVGEHCLVILQSSDLRIKFTFDQGSVEATLGPLSAPPSWEDLAAGEVVWFSMREVCEFLRGDPRPNLEDLKNLGNRLFAMSPDDQLEWLSELLRPVLGEAILLFRADRRSRAQFVEYYHS
jgi:hypothetical protein